jgi:hypothetical protein
MNFRGRKITAALLAGGALFSGAGIGSAIAATGSQTITPPATMTPHATHMQGRGHSGPPRGNDQVRNKLRDAIARTLGITTAQLTAARQAGTTPAQLARQKGVPTARVMSAVTAVIKANKPAGAPTLTDSQLAEMAGYIVNGIPQGRSAGAPVGQAPMGAPTQQRR